MSLSFYFVVAFNTSVHTNLPPASSLSQSTKGSEGGMGAAFLSVIGIVKKAEDVSSSGDEAGEESPEDKFRKVLVPTIVRWAEESFIEDPQLIREMFR